MESNKSMKIKKATNLCGLRKKYYSNGLVAGFIVVSAGRCRFQKKSL